MRSLLQTPGPSLREFLTAWYGPADKAPSPLPSSSVPVPSALTEWFETVSCWSAPVTVQNTVVPLDELEDEDGKVVFWVESEGVWLWAYDVREASQDPAVFDRECEDDVPWTPSGLTLSSFLLQPAVFEAVMGAEHPAATDWIPADRLSEALAPLDPLPGPDWNWPANGSHLYAGDGLLGFAINEGEDGDASDGWSVVTAAQPARPTAVPVLHSRGDVAR